MEAIIALSKMIHLSVIGLWVLLILGQIYLLKTKRRFYNLSKRLELWAPQYYIVLFTVVFTGSIMLAIQGFTLSLGVFGMVLATFIMAFSALKLKPYYKRALFDESLRDAYKAAALKKYLLDCLIIVITTLFYYGVR